MTINNRFGSTWAFLAVVLFSCGGSSVVVPPSSGDGGVIPDPDEPPATDAAPFECPSKEPAMGASCAWPAQAACTYPDSCNERCEEKVMCIDGKLSVSGCAYAMGCPVDLPTVGTKCTCGEGSSFHAPGEWGPCGYDDQGACSTDGGTVVRCSRETSLWERVEDAHTGSPRFCPPRWDAGRGQ